MNRLIKYILSVILFGYSISFAQINRGEFNKSESKENVNKLSLIRSNDSWSLYKLAPVLDSYNQMYLATKDVRYLENSVELINQIIDLSSKSNTIRTSQFKDKYYTWVNKSHEQKKNDGKEYPLFESYLWRYVTTTLVLIKENNLDNKFHKDYSNILNFTEVNIYNKWNNRGTSNIYRENTNMFALWAHITLNLWILTSKIEYEKVYIDFNTKFKNNLVYNNDGTVFWNSFFDKKKWTKEGQDVSHANAEVAYFIDAFQKTKNIDASLIKGLIATLEKKIIKNDFSTAMYLDGTGNSKGRIVDGFMKLGRFDQHLQNMLKKMKFYSPSQYYIKSQFIAVLLANDNLLSEK